MDGCCDLDNLGNLDGCHKYIPDLGDKRIMISPTFKKFLIWLLGIVVVVLSFFYITVMLYSVIR